MRYHTRLAAAPTRAGVRLGLADLWLTPVLWGHSWFVDPAVEVYHIMLSPLWVLVGALGVLVVVLLVLWLQATARLRAATQDRAALQERVQAAALALARAEGDRAAQEDRRAAQASAEQQLRDAFQALSADALRANAESFLQLARHEVERLHTERLGEMERHQQALGAVVDPLRDGLAQVGVHLRELDQARATTFGSLAERLEQVQSASQALRHETGNLVRALRIPHVRGRWGEVHLRRVVELAGLVDRVDFTEQPTVQADGARLRPDLVVHLPGNKCIVIDAKVPLLAYLTAIESADDEARKTQLAQHAQQVRQHVDALARKAYWEQFGEATPEVVVLFLPADAMLAAALEADPMLLDDAAGRRVLLASPTTLIGLLKSIAYGWRQDRLAANAQAISALGRELHDRLATCMAYFVDMGRGLERAVRSYNAGIGSLESRVCVSARRFQDLDAATGASIPMLAPVDVLLRDPQWAAQGDGDEPVG